MKKFIIILLLLFTCACSKNEQKEEKPKETIISFTNNIKIDCYTDINFYNLISIENGKIITENFKIDTTKIGDQTIKFDYKDINNNTISDDITIKIVDEVKPTIISSSTYYLETGNKFDILDDIVCGDNYDKNPKCSIFGHYDENKEGEYELKILIEDSSGNTNEKDIKLIVKDKFDSSSSNEKFTFAKLKELHKNDKTEVGIDVSTWQGDINWKQVKNEGVEFAILRIGFGHTRDGEIVLDDTFKQNIKGAKEAGIKTGIYFYSYAENEKEAKEEAKWIIDILDGEKLDLPITFDWEDWSDFNDYNINFSELNQIANSFLTEIEKSGYKSMLYGSATYLEKIWNQKNYPTWLAHYTDKTDYTEDYYIWQLSNKGKVNGINADVDLNVLYK